MKVDYFSNEPASVTICSNLFLPIKKTHLFYTGDGLQILEMKCNIKKDPFSMGHELAHIYLYRYTKHKLYWDYPLCMCMHEFLASSLAKTFTKIDDGFDVCCANTYFLSSYLPFYKFKELNLLDEDEYCKDGWICPIVKITKIKERSFRECLEILHRVEKICV